LCSVTTTGRGASTDSAPARSPCACTTSASRASERSRAAARPSPRRVRRRADLDDLVRT
jgi:hypothetical protein